MLNVFEFGDILMTKVENFEDDWRNNREFPRVLDEAYWCDQFESYLTYLTLQPE